MSIVKAREYECPKCGEFEHTYNSSTDLDLDLNEEDEGNIYEVLSIRRGCPVCGHHWIEYFRLVYDGCATEGKYYDENGREPTS